MTLDKDNEVAAQQDSSERDRLARERTSMANERTFLSYVRTSIMLFATGATIVKLFPSSISYIIPGVILVGIGFFALAMGILRYRRMKRKINGNEQSATS